MRPTITFEQTQETVRAQPARHWTVITVGWFGIEIALRLPRKPARWEMAPLSPSYPSIGEE